MPFDDALVFVLAEEGGYVNHPSDPGGETNMGISKRAHPGEDIKGLTVERAGEIYREDYWQPVRGDDLPSGLDLAAFDFAVNSGVRRASKTLQRIAGAVQDGAIGPRTLAAVAQHDATALLERYLLERCNFYCRQNKPMFLKGWMRRLTRLAYAAGQRRG